MLCTVPPGHHARAGVPPARCGVPSCPTAGLTWPVNWAGTQHVHTGHYDLQGQILDCQNYFVTERLPKDSRSGNVKKCNPFFKFSLYFWTTDKMKESLLEMLSFHVINHSQRNIIISKETSSFLEKYHHSYRNIIIIPREISSSFLQKCHYNSKRNIIIIPIEMSL